MNTDNISALDRLLAGQASASVIAREIITESRAGLEQFCDIPTGYRHCKLEQTTCNLGALSEAETRNLIENPPGAIVNPTQVHREAMEFFRKILAGDPLVCENGDPLRPTVGAYLVGPPGVGKTHLMAAFGLRIKQQLDQELARMESKTIKLIDQLYATTLHQQAEWSRHPVTDDNRWVLSAPQRLAAAQAKTGEEVLQLAMQADVRLKKLLPPEERFAAAVNYLQQWVRSYADQPTDLLYLGFEDLVDELQQDPGRRARVFAALERARLVFIDDIHPKGDPARLQVIQQLIERRYALDRPGTFLTTNLTAEELGAGDRTIAQRLLSRCSENFIKFNFSECSDWRMAVKARRIQWIEKAIKEQPAQP